MAGIWTGATLNTNALSNMFNRIMSKELVPMAVKGNATMYYLLGETQKGEYVASGIPTVKRVNTTSGNEVEFSMLGALPTPAYVADGSAEYAAATFNYDAALSGAISFPLSHLALTHAVPDSEYDRFKGNEMKTVSWLSTLGTYLTEGYMAKLSTDFHADSTSAVPARSKFASWITAVDSDNTYGLDRSDSGNADFRSLEVTSFGAFNYPDIMANVVTQATTYNAKIRVAVAYPTVYNVALNYANSMSLITNPGDHVAFGAQTMTLGGIKWISDQKCPTDAIGLFDPDWWEIIYNDTRPFVDPERMLVTDPGKVGTRVVITGLWAQNICKKPANQIKIRGVTV